MPGTLVAAEGEDAAPSTAPGVMVRAWGADKGALEGTEGAGLTGEVFATPAGPGLEGGFGFVEVGPAATDTVEGARGVVEGSSG